MASFEVGDEVIRISTFQGLWMYGAPELFDGCDPQDCFLSMDDAIKECDRRNQQKVNL